VRDGLALVYVNSTSTLSACSVVFAVSDHIAIKIA